MITHEGTRECEAVCIPQEDS
ncbi:hypothetical protein MPLB_2420046 [Mesorhizobium sp. ORS 3324]|nr:hypothetical protein MPLB_2420046 [Mesorhizobium sp. ORS 3324]